MNAFRIRNHAARIIRQLGRPTIIGTQRYRVPGYFANRIELERDGEPWMTAVLRRALDGRPGAFIDVGVNTGQTLAKVLAIDPARRYVGFEPQIDCCFFVDQFLRRNALVNASVVPVALSDESRVCSLYSDSACDTMATIVDAKSVDGHVRSRATLVSVRPGDEVLAEIGVGEVAAVKIDVEGAEFQVVSGLMRTLAEKRPTVIVEVLPNFFGAGRAMQEASVCARNRSAAERLYALLGKAGYAVSQIDERNGTETEVGAFNLDDAAGYVGSNYTARPRA